MNKLIFDSFVGTHNLKDGYETIRFLIDFMCCFIGTLIFITAYYAGFYWLSFFFFIISLAVYLMAHPYSHKYVLFAFVLTAIVQYYLFDNGSSALFFLVVGLIAFFIPKFGTIGVRIS